jgi:hypothetical protein
MTADESDNSENPRMEKSLKKIEEEKEYHECPPRKFAKLLVELSDAGSSRETITRINCSI